ncbi:hypothetical protein LCGC14_1832720, partial [marine sediment metagenome]
PSAGLEIQVSGKGTAIFQRSQTSVAGAGIFYKKSRGSLATPTIVQNGDFLSGFETLGFDGSVFLTAANITMEVDGTPGANDMPGKVVLWTTADGESSASRRVTIKNSGLMGIGATVPLAQLHIDQLSGTATIPVLLLGQADFNEPFTKYVGTAAAANLTRSIVDDGDVTTATLVGWTKIEIDDVGNQVADGDYFRPFYSLA